MKQITNQAENIIITDIRTLIEQTRQQVAVAVNSAMTLMYWHIGERINREVLGGERAAYGKQIVATLARQLTDEYGGNQFSEKNLNRMRLFAERFHDISIWTPLVSKLSWSHFLQIIPIEDELKRQFYLTMAADQRWSKRTLKSKIDGMLYERTAIAKQPEEVRYIVYLNEAGLKVARQIEAELKGFQLKNIKEFDGELFRDSSVLVFVGALGVCVRAIAPYVQDKHTDPAVVCVDSAGRNVISVLSGHVGGANEICGDVARVLGANPVITTQSDNFGYWALDTLDKRYGWVCEAGHDEMNRAIATLVNGEPVALLLDIRDKGTDMMEDSLPSNVKLIKDIKEADGCKLIIAVTPYIYHSELPILYYRPQILNLGVGCRRDCDPAGVTDYIARSMEENGISPDSVRSVSTIDLKKDEAVVAELAKWQNVHICNIFTADELKDIAVPNPSEKVREVTGVAGVAESCALKASDGGKLILEKQKGKVSDGADFTFAVAMDAGAMRGGHIEIVGAGPGDPDLVSVRGRKFLERADLILYAGSLVPKELTYCAKPGCVVRSSASMNLEEQFELMKEFYDRDKLVVRLHTGDPCIYGAIQEQMAFFDRYGMSYHITPGISSFQAAAAALRSQFTIPEKVQTIILTRGEGRTPMPEKEQLHKLAASQSTMCIYLSAGIVDDVQRELLMAYPPETPVAACYKLTWKEEKIYRGVLKDLAKIVHDNNLTLTTLLVVGDAIDNREGLSRLYADSFKHLFRH